MTDVLLILLRTICGATHSPTHAPVATRPRSWFNVTFCGALAARQCNFKLCLQCGERPNYTISFCSARTRWHFATLMDCLIGAAAGVALFHTQIVAHIGMGMAWFCGVNFT